jgi:hypothetical protein
MIPYLKKIRYKSIVYETLFDTLNGDALKEASRKNIQPCTLLAPRSLP